LIGAAIGAASVLSSNDYCQSPGSGPDCRRTMANIGGIFIGIEGAILGGIIGVVSGIDTNYGIYVGINEFQSALPKLKKEAIFPSNPASVLEIQ